MPKIFNVMDYCTAEDRPDQPEVAWYAVDPAAMYPAMADHIINLVNRAGYVAPAHLTIHHRDAKNISDAGWTALTVPRDQVGDDVATERAAALECCRRWFTAMLHAAISGTPMGVHIIRNLDWRL